MKKILSVILFLIVFLSVLSQASLSKNITLDQKSVDDNYQDGRNIEKLQWKSIDGKLPGTYKEYIDSHPLIPAVFKTPNPSHGKSFFSFNTTSILVDEDLYPQIYDQLDQYIYDLEFESRDIFVQTVTGGTPEDIKDWVIERFDQGSSSIVFIGDITAAWAEVSDSVFPCDLFYMDLDGEWTDADHDGIYESHEAGSGDMGPEVYIGRIYASTLTYDTEANMVNEYLSKVHDYRTGVLTQPWRGLEYVEEDWYDMDVFLRLVYGDDVARYDYGFFTTAEDYLNQLDLGQHFVQVCVHSYSGGHYFSTRPTESVSYGHVYVYSPTARPGKLLIGSDDGIKIWLNGENVYTNDRYGGWQADAYEVDINLLQGWNQLLCKVSQEGGDYMLSVQITDQDYQTYDDLTYQVNNPDLYGPESEYIRSWLLNGFHQDISDNFWNYLTTNYLGVDEPSINPHQGDMMGGMIWNTYDSGYPFIDLSDYDESDYGVTYGFVRINSDESKNCQLWMGYDDGARVWLNGQEVLFDNRYGEFTVDMSKFNITLQPGENRLLVKISEWMGTHGFSARVCNSDGSPVDGLSYDPESVPINYIGTWLFNGPYVNPDQETRLSEDYLLGEADVTPSEGDSAPFGVWERAIGSGCPFNIGTFYDRGDWVLSEDVQARDPPVLFYNLFACGPGRFTDENYLAGAYIYHTTYGLITIASSKSGSMLNFDDFYRPLGDGKCIGEAFYDWFDAQAPFALWEQEWYYGMVICGDPTLSLNPQTLVKITKPENAVYLFDTKILPFITPVIIGKITVDVEAENYISGIDHVEFYVDDSMIDSDDLAPYSFSFDNRVFFRHTIKATAYDNSGGSSSDEIVVWKFF